MIAAIRSIVFPAHAKIPIDERFAEWIPNDSFIVLLSRFVGNAAHASPRSSIQLLSSVAEHFHDSQPSLIVVGWTTNIRLARFLWRGMWTESPTHSVDWGGQQLDAVLLFYQPSLSEHLMAKLASAE